MSTKAHPAFGKHGHDDRWCKAQRETIKECASVAYTLGDIPFRGENLPRA